MKIFQVVLIALSFVLLVIGIDQTISVGFKDSYFIFMFMIACFLGYTYLKGKENMKNSGNTTPPAKSKRSSTKK